MFVKRSLWFAKPTIRRSITFEASNKKQLWSGNCNSDCAKCNLDRKCTFQYVYLVEEGAVSRKCMKRSMVMASTSEADYSALGPAALEYI